MPSESSVLNVLLKVLRKGLPNFLIVKRADLWTIGIPDVEASGNKLTSFFEFKIADPTFKSTGIQELNMLLLERYAHCAKYIIWDYRDKREKRTYIVSPRNFKDWDTKFDHVFEGFDHTAVLNYIRKVHGLDQTTSDI